MANLISMLSKRTPEVLDPITGYEDVKAEGNTSTNMSTMIISDRDNVVIN